MSEKSVVSEVKEVSPSFEKMSFYWLHVTSLEKILPRFLEKLYAQGVCAVIRTIHTARVEELCRLLWTYPLPLFYLMAVTKMGFLHNNPSGLRPQTMGPTHKMCQIFIAVFIFLMPINRKKFKKPLLTENLS